MDTLIYGQDTWSPDSDDSPLHAEAKEHLAQCLLGHEEGVYGWIEYPLPWKFSQYPKQFLWSKHCDDLSGRSRFGDDDYYTFNSFHSSVPTAEAARREFEKLSFVFDIGVEGPRGLIGAFEIRVSSPVKDGKKRYMRHNGLFMHEIDAKWLLDNFPDKTPCLVTVEGRILCPHEFFRP